MKWRDGFHITYRSRMQCRMPFQGESRSMCPGEGVFYVEHKHLNQFEKIYIKLFAHNPFSILKLQRCRRAKNERIMYSWKYVFLKIWKSENLKIWKNEKMKKSKNKKKKWKSEIRKSKHKMKKWNEKMKKWKNEMKNSSR